MGMGYGGARKLALSTLRFEQSPIPHTLEGAVGDRAHTPKPSLDPSAFAVRTLSAYCLLTTNHCGSAATSFRRGSWRRRPCTCCGQRGLC